MKHCYLYLIIPVLIFVGCDQPKKPHIVFIMGDEEYRSEESMPMIAKIAKQEFDAEISLCYSVDTAGYIDPNRLDHIQGLEALAEADLAVFFMRFRALPKAQLDMINNYVESGRPIIGFRTSTHAFLYKEDSTLMHMNDQWPTDVFGQQWITHHGHFDDGDHYLTKVDLFDTVNHPILNGINPFKAHSWLYHVDGGEWKLKGDCTKLLTGEALRSRHQENENLERFGLTNPVAWTKTYRGQSGVPSKVFFTTLGHPYDFKDLNMRKLVMNAIGWILDYTIPSKGYDGNIIGEYNPNNSGFGMKYKPNQKPLEIK